MSGEVLKFALMGDVKMAHVLPGVSLYRLIYRRSSLFRRFYTLSFETTILHLNCHFLEAPPPFVLSHMILVLVGALHSTRFSSLKDVLVPNT